MGWIKIKQKALKEKLGNNKGRGVLRSSAVLPGACKATHSHRAVRTLRRPEEAPSSLLGRK